MKNRFYSLFIFLLIINTGLPALSQPSPKYELRGVWVATVLNIDWPSKPGLPVAEQKAEYIRLLDMHQRNGMNAIFMQVRPSADAFYPSPYEPWSEYLNGRQGQPPVPFYDPLQFMIEETHKRGMEFHAWINPYRAVFHVYKSSVSPNHITHIHPEWFLTYGDKKYFDPGEPEVMKYTVQIVRDIVTRYDIDGIHMDDYFYPYRITGKEFPDNKNYKKYGRGLNKDDWRRSNCDSVIKQLHEAILSIKPMIKFGISPFGVWRNKSQDPNGSDTQAGQTNYDDLYADILLWMREGWIDYVTPQLYWEIGHRLCDYTILLKWWAEHSYGKHVYIGHGIYRTVENPTAKWRNPKELPDEINLLRSYPAIQGSVFFNSKVFESNPNGWTDSLHLHFYKTPALVPPMDWIDSVPPTKPVISNARESNTSNGETILKIDGHTGESVETEDIKSYVLYVANSFANLGQSPSFVSVADSTHRFSFDIWTSQIPLTWNDCYIAITCIDRENNESPLSNAVQFIKTKKGWVIPKK